jgi:hypothetical protein
MSKTTASPSQPSVAAPALGSVVASSTAPSIAHDAFRSKSIWWLVPALLLAPVFLIGAAFEEDNLANMAQALATSTILWFPMLCLVAITRPHFRALHASVATLLFVLYDSLSVRETLYAVIDPYVPMSGNPNWITLCIIVGAVAGLIVATLVRPTLARIVILTAASAQIVTLLLFHYVTVTAPIEVARTNERAFIEAYTQAYGTPEGLCNIDGRICYHGSARELLATVVPQLLSPYSVRKILEDQKPDAEVLYTWTEAAFASTADEAMRHISVHGDGSGSVLVLINEKGPTQAFTQMKLAFSILAGAFLQTWTTISLLIIWRHGDFALKRGRWVRVICNDPRTST